jgi:hypothetical protein
MNKYFIFASDERSYLDLINVVLEIKKRNLPYFFLYSRESQRIAPSQDLNKFSYDSNIDLTSEPIINFATLGFSLSFKPTHLIITNENWEPEKSILYEFKTKGCFISCVNGSTWLRSGIKGKLELASRKRFPSNCIDIYFSHSKRCKEIQELGGMYPHQSIVTGNPRNDNINYDCVTENIIIVYGSMEREHHSKLLKIYKEVKNKYPQWVVYYKPHPNELIDFPNDFTNVKIVSSYEEYFKILPKSNYNIGMFGSVMYFPLFLNKNIICVDSKDSGLEEEENIENYRGHEFNFWSKILNFKDFDEFKNFIGLDFLKSTKEINKQIDKSLRDNLDFYKKDIIFKPTYKNNKKILKYFDEFNDKKASNRIINYLEGEK